MTVYRSVPPLARDRRDSRWMLVSLLVMAVALAAIGLEMRAAAPRPASAHPARAPDRGAPGDAGGGSTPSPVATGDRNG
jgi:hypothetical protein